MATSFPSTTPAAIATTAPTATASTAGAAAPSFALFRAQGLGRVQPTHEALNNALTHLREQVKLDYDKRKIDPAYKVNIIPIDANRGAPVRYSGLAVCVTHDALKNTVAVHTVIVEASAEAPAPKTETYSGVSYEVVVTAGDAYDKDYWAVTKQLVEAAYPGHTVNGTDGQVLHKDFNYGDKVALERLTENVWLPCTTLLRQNMPGFQDMSMQMLGADMLTVRPEWNAPNTSDYAGNPVRGDIQIKVTVVSPTTAVNKGAINQPETSAHVGAAHAFIDPVWNDKQDNNNMLPFMGGRPTPKFIPRLVITQLENTAMQTIPAQLLMVAATTAIREGGKWFNYFTPRRLAAQHRVDWRDVGVLAIEGSPTQAAGEYGKPVDTKTESFRVQELHQFLAAMFVHDQFYFTLKVSDCGSDTWFNSVFKEAANNNPHAIKAILDGANYLTNGHFAKHYTSANNPVAVNQDVVHTGHYLRDGEKCDIADIDYIAVMNLVGTKNPAIGAAWSNTFYGMSDPMNAKLAARWRIIQEITGGTAVMTGKARLVTFKPAFIEALIKAMADTGKTFRYAGASADAMFQQRAGGTSWLGDGTMNVAPSGLFASGVSANPNNNLFGGGAFSTRWY